MFNRLNRAFQQAIDPDKLPAQGRQPTLETLLPGDVVSFWDDGDGVVEAVLECSENLNSRDTRWRWNLLDEGRMLSVAPEGDVLYRRTVVLHQADADFETLTSDPEQGGVLKSFEARVRTGTAARQPVLFEFGGRTFRIVSTGTFDAKPAGSRSFTPGAYSKLEVWRDIHPTDPGQNVYFELQPTEEDEASGETTVLGIWTSHIALLFGREVHDADVQAIYPRAEPEGKPKS
jgi:hypothetical protein